MTYPIFIVGCPRSGTTLFRSMLDGHPRLAIPPESHFVISLWTRRLGLRDRPEAALEGVIAHPRFTQWGLDPDVLRAAVRATRPASYAGVMSAVFRAYAEAQGKPRWGDKTPLYGLHMPLLAEMFPGAKFIHVIRDGRDVAASLAAPRPGGPSPITGHARGAPTAVTSAFWWRNWVRRIRCHGERIGPNRYMEVRYEHLVADPAVVLTQVCHFIDETYDSAMLDYPKAVRRGATRVDVAGHPNLLREPQREIRKWRASVPVVHQRPVEAVARGQLTVLGYAASRPDPLAYVLAWLWRAWGLAQTWPRNVQRALHPGSRSL